MPEIMTLAAAVAVLNREGHRGRRDWLSDAPHGRTVACAISHYRDDGEGGFAWLTAFEAIAVAEKYSRDRPARGDAAGRGAEGEPDRLARITAERDHFRSALHRRWVSTYREGGYDDETASIRADAMVAHSFGCFVQAHPEFYAAPAAKEADRG